MKGIRRRLPLLGLGFFSLVSQTLLFRDVVGVFAHNELGIGVYYALRLLWIALAIG